jgi:hypothetical protein
MPTYEKCSTHEDGEGLLKIARTLLNAVPEHQLIERHKVKVDYLFAFADTDEDGQPINNALNKNGIRALGLCRKIGLKDRAKGMGDVEILIDHDHWKTIPEAEQRALLDHEMTHIQVCVNQRDEPKLDAIGRPKIKIRKHDVEVGWFASVAQRHGAASIEQIQAKQILDKAGQYFWPELVAPNGTQVSRGKIADKK